ncbi:MAG: GtrA family protein [Paludibacteraceae bacterium]|nr:GtrA family protein [Paludibacteraceae bacterium]
MGVNLKKYYQDIVKEKTDSTLVQLIRYTFVGGFSFLVDVGVLVFFTEVIHLHYLLSAGISFLFGLLVNYLLSVKWVFNARMVENKYLEFLLFLAIGLIGLGLNELFLWMLTDLAHVYYLISKILTAVVVYLWNFFARKILLFNRK